MVQNKKSEAMVFWFLGVFFMTLALFASLMHSSLPTQETETQTTLVFAEPNSHCAPHIFEQPQFFGYQCNEEGVCSNGIHTCQKSK